VSWHLQQLLSATISIRLEGLAWNKVLQILYWVGNWTSLAVLMRYA